ncbi:TetR/AcrR family transcriptional regulator [Streptomyces sp. H27-D2]|uniref:TetR/AcrR family transcriptional regulator n=1 Tax=Streptomyces sp. H27-D2 TaxID=3046304 RepID=UPI002DBC189F|nr:helix-turn-helix domain-containing protein [Streptomyces sp. H27-D2]MEC4018111.1 helix-turn-helix domain-containing protein [Streptomyces sp. H27-D2]
MHIQSSQWSTAVASVSDGNSRNAPLRVDAQRNLEHVLRAAREVFGELGYGAPMEDVARRARVGVGTVYRRFPSKDVLVRRIAEEETARLTDQARSALGQEDEPWSALSRFLRTSVASGAGRLLPPQVLRVGVDADASVDGGGNGVVGPGIGALSAGGPSAGSLVAEMNGGSAAPVEARVPQQRQPQQVQHLQQAHQSQQPDSWADTQPDTQPDLRLVEPQRSVEEERDDTGAAMLLEVVGRLVDRARAAGELRPDVTVADVLLVIATAAPSLPDPAQQAAASARLLDILLEGLRSR